jgi:hypothetical protein
MKPGPAMSAEATSALPSGFSSSAATTFVRVHFQLLRQLHGDIAGNVAVRRVARALEHHVGGHGGAFQQRRKGGLEQGGDLLFLLGEHGRFWSDLDGSKSV